MLKEGSVILVLAPHTDDGEFGAGASIARWISEGHDVHYLAFSSCETSVPDGWPKDVLRREVREATAVLGIPAGNLRILDFEVRHFARDRQQILQALIDIRAELDPDVVLMPSVDDLHQDHHVIALEGLRAFKQKTVLAYEVPWNNMHFRNSAYVMLSEADLNKKLEATACYKSQSHRMYVDPEYLTSHLRFRGTQAGVNLAESFDVIRWII